MPNRSFKAEPTLLLQCVVIKSFYTNMYLYKEQAKDERYQCTHWINKNFTKMVRSSIHILLNKNLPSHKFESKDWACSVFPLLLLPGVVIATQQKACNKKKQYGKMNTLQHFNHIHWYYCQGLYLNTSFVIYMKYLYFVIMNKILHITFA